MCLASLLYHREWIMNYVPRNSVIITDSICFRLQDVVTNLVRFPDMVKVIYPWLDNNNINGLMGIPPHASLLHHVHHIKYH
jgi:hypothetical protein